MKRLPISALIAYLVAFAPGTLHAQNLLIDGNFENAATVPGWDLLESIFDQTTMMDRNLGDINSAQQQNFNPEDGPLALWLRAFEGGATAGPDNLINAALVKTLPASPGEQFTFSGHSRFEFNYSGGVNTLSPTSPLGAVPSPTTTTMKLEFLDAGGSVVGTPVTLDVKADRITQIGFPDPNDDGWYQHTLMGTAPPSAAQVRVTAEARQMIRNTGGQESAFYDSFSLMKSSMPEVELLENPGLDEAPDRFHAAWTVTQVPGGNIPTDPTIGTESFASRPEGVGQLGAWLRSFTGNIAQPADAILEQTVPAMPGQQYKFSGWSNFQANYSGGVSMVGSDPSPTQTLFQLEFLDAGNTVLAQHTLDLKADGQTNGAGWRLHELTGTAPAGTANVRVRAAGLDMVTNPAGGQQSAFLDDLSLELVGGALAGDFDMDNDVDGTDFLIWQRNYNTLSFDDWKMNFGTASAVAAGGAVPEPTAAVSALVAVALAVAARRRRNDG